MGGAMFLSQIHAQHVVIKPYNIGDRVPAFPLTHLINSEKDSTSISSFGNKLIILDFWGTHCSSCIQALPEENDLQSEFKDQVQFIMVTPDDKENVSSFLERYDKKNQKLSIPIVTSDILIQQMFAHIFLPHYVWLGPDGLLMAQTTASMVSREVIQTALAEIQKRKDHLDERHFSEKYFQFPEPNAAQKQYFQQYKY